MGLLIDKLISVEFFNLLTSVSTAQSFLDQWTPVTSWQAGRSLVCGRAGKLEFLWLLGVGSLWRSNSWRGVINGIS